MDLEEQRERQGLCHVCGEQGLFICCRKTWCGVCSMEHLKTKDKWKIFQRNKMENRTIVDSTKNKKSKRLGSG